jgi:phosphomannomutase
MIVSVSGIRGILNQDLSGTTLANFARNFADSTSSTEFLLARDTRSTGTVIGKAVSSALLSRGATVFDFGVISTPAIFRESRERKKPAIMITASHNEPEFNGLKFLVNGIGIDSEYFKKIVGGGQQQRKWSRQGTLKHEPRARYNDDLIRRFGEGTCEGVRVALDLGGGAAINHAPAILKKLGCNVFPINGSPGIFNRRIDPMADELLLLQKMVRAKECEVGLGFDCDGDRLAIVDNGGRKRSGDFMLTLALSHALSSSDDKRAVVSVDTTQAVEDVVNRLNGKVFRSKVGEANVVGLMREKNIRLGGEGSSGGLIDGSFNFCRDSMLAALIIIRALKENGVAIYAEVKGYQQVRSAFQIKRTNAMKAIRIIASKGENPDTTDGVKLKLSPKSWVLIRPSGTEDLVRISAEAETIAKAEEIVHTYSSKLRELSR